jgi:arabinose-5-phosphate isomerase
MYGATAVLEENTIIGIITDGDIRRVIEKKQNIENISALDFMNNSPKIMNQSTLAIEALKHMKENSISQVLIANDNNKYLGIVHILDIIKQGISYE